ncbi:MAG: aminotransferase class V-fold PLP-dependent enzyme [Chlorobia bacterium]|nr:aminotransferase class V-fold PLP-dependent enzyme [Fimbriimonadaceae bacterium]
MLTRRQFFGTTLALAAFRNDALDMVEKLVSKDIAAADNEEFWLQIRQAFALDPNIANFNNGGCSPAPRVVQDALKRQIDYANQAPSYYMWQHLEPEVEHVRKRLAKAFGCDHEEMAITRNASEALEICLLGIGLKAGDEVLTTTMDYPRMITTLRQRERRDGIKLVQVDPPHVPNRPTDLLAAFQRGLTPQTKLILVSQVSFLNGQIFPVRDVVELGRKNGIPVVVDGAHAFAQFPFQRDSLGCDYYGTSLHKWLMAPMGTGFLSVRKEKVEALWPLMAADVAQTKDIRKFEEIGTHPAANHNAIGEALTFHELIGVDRKAARFRYLRSRWADKIREENKVVFHTNLEATHSCAIATVEIKGIMPVDLAGWLLTKHGIYVTTIGHPQFGGIRVTPNVYSTIGEVDRFADAMLIAARSGIS